MSIAEQAVIVLLSALAVGSLACALLAGGGRPAQQLRGGALAGAVIRWLNRWRTIWITASRDGSVAPGVSQRRILLFGSAACALIGFSVLGVAGLAIGAIAGPYAVRKLLSARRERFAARIDACAAEFALALASALAGGNSVRGALLAATRATPEPLARELDRACVDLTLGQSVEDALATLRARTSSARIESLAGAIELHSSSGGDLVRLMRELAAAFRTRDIAQRDARAATAQARFTAVIVAAIPLTLAVIAELARPGAVSGVFTFAPTAMLMVAALALLVCGCLLCVRIGRVG